VDNQASDRAYGGAGAVGSLIIGQPGVWPADGCLIIIVHVRPRSLTQSASGKMRICGPADLQTCKIWMVLRIFLADVTGKMRMQTQYYKLKKHMHFIPSN